MTIGSSLFLIAVGAILMIVGVVGLVLGLGLAMSARSDARRSQPPDAL
jgi:hypothetical protein